MLKRIQEIRKVGCFREDKPAAFEFDGLSFIFGENCYGKSTLCDVLRSVGENRPQYITERLSLPRSEGRGQSVRLSFQPQDEERESPVSFTDGRWTGGLPGSLRLHIFDSEFIYRNVFTGLSIERQNQENITRFILGEKGVELAQEIADLKSTVRDLKKDLRTRASAFEGVTDLAAYLDMEIEESAPVLDNKVIDCSKALDRARRLSADLEAVRMRPDPTPIETPEDLDSLVEEINSCLGNEFVQVNRRAVEVLERHMSHSTANNVHTKDWLKRGLEQVIQDSCPFCGQALGDRARVLLDAYRLFFDQAFSEHAVAVEKGISSFPSQLQSLADPAVPELLLASTRRAERYYDVIDDSAYQEAVQSLDQASQALRQSWGLLHESLKVAGQDLASRLAEKRGAVYAQFGAWEPVELLTLYRAFLDSCSRYNRALEEVASRVKTFKGKLDSTQMETQLSECEEKLAVAKLRQRRLRDAAACSRYREIQGRVRSGEACLEEKQVQLDQDQASYLSQYFGRIDELFQQLGSDGFRITHQENRRGNLPTVQLTASYQGQPIRPNAERAFFSESDRRALALSVFWAKVDSLSEREKADAIIVLDDPITSFDEGRVDRTIRMLSAGRRSFRQVIVMSHYPRFLKAFFERARGETTGIALRKLVKTESGSHIQGAAPEDFVDTVHHRRFKRIKDFSEWRTPEDVQQDLRVFLEEELHFRFRWSIEVHGLGSRSLRDLIEGLHETGSLTEEQRDELVALVDSLNVDHHTWAERSHQDQVTLARDVLELVYHKL